MNWRQWIARHIFDIRAEELPWAQDAWNAVKNGGPLRIIETDDLVELLGLDPGTDPEVRQLENTQISIFYVKSSNGDPAELRETLDILVTEPSSKRGGMIVRFMDGRAVSWNRPSARERHEVPERERFWYVKALESVRAVGRST